MLEDFDSVFSVPAVLLPAAKPILPGRAQTPDGQAVLWPEPSSADGHTGPGLRVGSGLVTPCVHIPASA